jgi:hypothetical protein
MDNTPLGFHVMLRLRDDRVIATSTWMRRRLARVVLEQCADFGLLAFRAADTHLHLEVACARAAAGELARRIEIALGRCLRLGGPFAPAHVRAIESQRHLQNTFHYILGQDARHGLSSDPLFEASNVPDLLGARLLGGYTLANVRAHLPRVRAHDLPLELPDSPAHRSLAQLADAAAAAACLGELHGKSQAVRDARCAALALANGRASVAELASLLAITAPTVRHLRAVPARPELVRAIERQLRLRQPRARTEAWSEPAFSAP